MAVTPGFFEIDVLVQDEIDYAPPRFLQDVAEATVALFAQLGLKAEVDVRFHIGGFACYTDDEEEEKEETDE